MTDSTESHSKSSAFSIDKILGNGSNCSSSSSTSSSSSSSGSVKLETDSTGSSEMITTSKPNQTSSSSSTTTTTNDKHSETTTTMSDTELQDDQQSSSLSVKIDERIETDEIDENNNDENASTHEITAFKQTTTAFKPPNREWSFQQQPQQHQMPIANKLASQFHPGLFSNGQGVGPSSSSFFAQFGPPGAFNHIGPAFHPNQNHNHHHPHPHHQHHDHLAQQHANLLNGLVNNHPHHPHHHHHHPGHGGLVGGSSHQHQQLHHNNISLHHSHHPHPHGLLVKPKKKRSRAAFSHAQVLELEKRFNFQRYLSGPERADLASSLKVETTTTIFFNNEDRIFKIYIFCVFIFQELLSVIFEIVLILFEINFFVFS